jgi:phosphoacetylglucosamine mutase
MALCQRGAAACGAAVEDVGIVTTPQLHHCVRMRNAPPALRAAYGGLEGYPRMLREGFVGVLGGLPPRAAERGALVVDCAHGVGALAAATLAAAFEGLVQLRLRNVGATPEEAACLNEGVGAEHCQKGRLPPAGFTAAADAGARAVVALDASSVAQDAADIVRLNGKGSVVACVMGRCEEAALHLVLTQGEAEAAAAAAAGGGSSSSSSSSAAPALTATAQRSTPPYS